MPSLITSVIGGVQGSSASHNAANALSTGYNQAGQPVTNAAAGVNPDIVNAGQAAGAGVTNAAATAGTNATGAAGTLVNNAGTAASNVNALATNAQSGVSPYTATGANAANTLNAGMAPGGSLNTPFNVTMMEQNDPGTSSNCSKGSRRWSARRLPVAR